MVSVKLEDIEVSIKNLKNNIVKVCKEVMTT